MRNQTANERIETVKSVFRRRRNRYQRDYIWNYFKERVFGVDLSFLNDTIDYYAEEFGIHLTREEAYQRVFDKQVHKSAWFSKVRESDNEARAFYSEIDIYPFRQPYFNRLGGYGWILKLIRHVECPNILEYGCGSAGLTEWLMRNRSSAKYFVADIPSKTLDFVRWKKTKYQSPVQILEIGESREGIPVRRASPNLIICSNVLEHTWSPLQIVEEFIEHLQPGGILYLDFINEPGGENLERAAVERPTVLRTLAKKLITIKSIDDDGTNDGLYMKTP